jgi:hypothetical protein
VAIQVNPGADKAKSISPVGDLIHHVQHGLPVAKEWHWLRKNQLMLEGSPAKVQDRNDRRCELNVLRPNEYRRILPRNERQRGTGFA